MSSADLETGARTGRTWQVKPPVRYKANTRLTAAQMKKEQQAGFALAQKQARERALKAYRAKVRAYAARRALWQKLHQTTSKALANPKPTAAAPGTTYVNRVFRVVDPDTNQISYVTRRVPVAPPAPVYKPPTYAGSPNEEKLMAAQNRQIVASGVKIPDYYNQQNLNRDAQVILDKARAQIGTKQAGVALENLTKQIRALQKQSNNRVLDANLVKQVYDAYRDHVQRVASQFNTKVDELKTLYVLDAKGNLVKPKSRDSAFKAEALYGSPEFKAIQDEYRRLYEGKGVGGQGSVAGFQTLADEIGSSQRGALYDIAKQTVLSRSMTLRKTGEPAEAAALMKEFMNGAQYLNDDYTDIVKAAIDPSKTSFKLVRQKDGEMISVQRTVDEEYEYRRAVYVSEMRRQYANAQNDYTLAQADVREGKRFTREGDALQSDIFRAANSLGITEPDRDRASLRASIDQAMRVWDAGHKAPSSLQVSAQRGQGGTTAEYAKWKAQRDDQERRYYDYFHAKPPDGLEAVTDFAPVKGAFSLVGGFFGGVSAAIKYGATVRDRAPSELLLSAGNLDYNVLPTAQRNQVDALVNQWTSDKEWIRKNYPPAMYRTDAATLAGLKTIARGQAVDQVARAFMQTPEGDKWSSETGQVYGGIGTNTGRNSAEKKRLFDELSGIYQGFNVNTLGNRFADPANRTTGPGDLLSFNPVNGNSAVGQGQPDFGKFLDTMAASGGGPFSPDSIVPNLFVGAVLDPLNLATNPLSWIKRLRFAAEATKDVSGFRRAVLGTSKWLTATETDLRLDKFLRAQKVVRDSGMSEQMFRETLLTTLSGVKDKAVRKAGIDSFLQIAGVTARDKSYRQVFSLVEDALNGFMEKKAINHIKLVDEIKALDNAEKAAKEALKAPERAESAAIVRAAEQREEAAAREAFAARERTTARREAEARAEPVRQTHWDGIPIRRAKSSSRSGVAYNPRTRAIHINEPRMKTQFESKAWTRPTRGESALPADTFRTLDEWRTFSLNRELQRSRTPRLPGESAGAYEDRINSIVLGRPQPHADVLRRGAATPVAHYVEQIGRDVESLSKTAPTTPLALRAHRAERRLAASSITDSLVALARETIRSDAPVHALDALEASLTRLKGLPEYREIVGAVEQQIGNDLWASRIATYLDHQDYFRRVMRGEEAVSALPTARGTAADERAAAAGDAYRADNFEQGVALDNEAKALAGGTPESGGAMRPNAPKEADMDAALANRAVEREDAASAAPPPPRAVPPEPDGLVEAMASGSLEVASGLNEEQWLRREVERAARLYETGPRGERKAALARKKDAELALRVLAVMRSGGSFVPPLERAARIRRSVRINAKRAIAAFAPSNIAGYASSIEGAAVEQVRSLRRKLLTSPVNEEFSRVEMVGEVSKAYKTHRKALHAVLDEVIPPSLLRRFGIHEDALRGITYGTLLSDLDEFKNAMRDPRVKALVDEIQTHVEARLRVVARNKKYSLQQFFNDALMRRGDFIEAAAWEADEVGVTSAINTARGYKRNTLTDLRRPGAKSSEPIAEIIDKDVAAIRAKAEYLNARGSSASRYNEGRQIYRPAYLRRQYSRRILAGGLDSRTGVFRKGATDLASDELTAAGHVFGSDSWNALWQKTLDKHYDILRKQWAASEAKNLLGQLTGEMEGASPEDVISVFEDQYGLSHDVVGYAAQPISPYQKRSLEESVKKAMGVADPYENSDKVKEYLKSHGQGPPDLNNATEMRDWFVERGIWTPRTAQQIEAGKKSWDIDEEAKFFSESWGEVPTRADRSVLSDTARAESDMFHNEDAYDFFQREWGAFNRALGGRFESSVGKTREQFARELATGNPALGIHPRRDLALMRKYAYERYKDLVGTKAADGTITLHSMPWLMNPEETKVYLRTRATKDLAAGLIQTEEELGVFERVANKYLKPYFEAMLSTKNPVLGPPGPLQSTWIRDQIEKYGSGARAANFGEFPDVPPNIPILVVPRGHRILEEGVINKVAGADGAYRPVSDSNVIIGGGIVVAHDATPDVVIHEVGHAIVEDPVNLARNRAATALLTDEVIKTLTEKVALVSDGRAFPHEVLAELWKRHRTGDWVDETLFDPATRRILTDLRKLVSEMDVETRYLIKDVPQYVGHSVENADILTVVAYIVHDLMEDPVWAKRNRDSVGDLLRWQANVRRRMIFTQGGFFLTNAVDAGVKTAMTSWTHRTLIGGTQSAKAASHTLVSYGLDRSSTLLSDVPVHGTQLLRAAYVGSNAQRFSNWLRRTKITPVSAMDAAALELHAKSGLGRLLDAAVGVLDLPAQGARIAEEGAKLRLANSMYDGVYSRALKMFGDPESADLAARQFIHNEMKRIWPTVGDGSIERLFNMLSPFLSYRVRNMTFYVGTMAEHPALFNWFNRIGNAVEHYNRLEWAKTHDETDPINDAEARLIRLPWTEDAFIDLGSLTDFQRGVKPLYKMAKGGSMTLGEFASSWVTLVSPNDVNAVLGVMNEFHLADKYGWAPVMKDGFATGDYQRVIVPWEAPWGGVADWRNSIWPIELWKNFQTLAKGGLTAGEATVLGAQALIFGGVRLHDAGAGLNTYFWALRSVNPDAARDWLDTADGMKLRARWAEHAAEAADFFTPKALDEMLNPSHVDPKAWFHAMSLSYQKQVGADFEALSVMRAKWDHILSRLAPGTKEYKQAKLQAATEKYKFYEMHPELYDATVMFQKPEDWAKSLDKFVVDDLVQSYYDLEAPQREDFKTDAAFEAAILAYRKAQRLYLTKFPQVAAVVNGIKSGLDGVWQEQERHWFSVLDEVGTRGIAITAAREAKNFELTDQLYLLNELSFDTLSKDTLDFYYDPTTDYVTLPDGSKSLREGPFGQALVPLAKVLPDFNSWRFARMNEAEKSKFQRDSKYIEGMKGVIAKAKASGNFGATFVAEMKKHPDLLREYFARHPGKQDQWASNDQYIKAMGGYGALIKASRWSEAERYLANLPSWMRARYYAKHPDRKARLEENIKYMSLMGKWVEFYKRRDYTGGAAFFSSLPQWAKDRYYSAHPDGQVTGSSAYSKAMGGWVKLLQEHKTEEAKAYFDALPQAFKDRYYAKHPQQKLQSDVKRVAQLQQYFASDDANRGVYLADHPEFAKWLKAHDTSDSNHRMMVMAAYTTLPKDDQWLRRIFRERFPEIFSQEAKGIQATNKVFRSLGEHPELVDDWKKWVEAILASYADSVRHAKAAPRPLEFVHPRRMRKRPPHGRTVSAEWVRLHAN